MASFHSFREVSVAGEIAEAGELALEGQLHRACWAMALLADDHFGFAVYLVSLRQPFGELFAIGFQRLSHLMVILFAIDEQNHVGILLD